MPAARLAPFRRRFAAFEAIAAARDGGDETRAGFAERAAQLADALHQRVVGDHEVGPHRREDFFLADQAAGMRREMDEHREGLRPQRDFAIVQQQAAAVQIDHVAAECQSLLQPLCRRPGWPSRAIMSAECWLRNHRDGNRWGCLSAWVCGDVRVECSRRSLVSAPDGVRLRGAARQGCQRSMGNSAKRARQERTTKEELRADRLALRRSHASAWNIPPEHPRAPTHVEREDPSSKRAVRPQLAERRVASPTCGRAPEPCGSDLSQRVNGHAAPSKCELALLDRSGSRASV